MKRLAMTAALLLVAASASAAARAYDVRAVVEAIRRHSTPLSFIEADAVVRVVVDEQWPSEKLIAEVVRQSDRYSYADVAGRPVLFAKEPRYRLRVSAVKISSMARFDAVGAYVELLNRQHSEFKKFQGWGYVGHFLGGTPPYIPLLQDKVTLTPSAEVMEHFAQLLGDDRQVFFDVGFFNWGGVERRGGIWYGRIEGAATQSPSDVVGRIHGKPVLRRETVRGDLLLGRVLGTLLKEYAVAKHIDVSDDFVGSHKIHQALWRDFGGGRVIFQQFGPEPLDAYRRFLEMQQKKGAFEIVDKSLEASFWDYFRGEHHTVYDAAEGRRLMTTPWWNGK